LESANPPLLYSIESPPTGVRYRAIDTKVTIERNAKADRLTEVSLVSVEVLPVSEFFIEGPIKRLVVVFSGQKSVIPIRFLPLTAGSMKLPQITLIDSEGGTNGKSKILLAPIVITYTS
jgi:hypothetical protein